MARASSPVVRRRNGRAALFPYVATRDGEIPSAPRRATNLRVFATMRGGARFAAVHANVITWAGLRVRSPKTVRARMVNVEQRMRTHTDGRALRASASLWDRGELRHFHTRCDVCRAPARTTRGGMLLCRDCSDAARPHHDDDAYDDVSAGD